MKHKKKLAAVVIAVLTILLNVYIWTSPITGENPFLVKLGLSVVLSALGLVCIWQMESLFRIPLSIVKDRVMFWELVKNDFQARFAGSYLGLFWAFFQPVITIALYWFVFQVGLKSGDMSSHPFILYLMCGLVPWFYFSESWGGATGSLVEYNYLVKKVVFNVEFLPALKVFSALFVHLFFVAVIAVMSLCYGYALDLYMLQILYYILCTGVLVLGLSYITAALNVFFRDMTQIINIVLTVGVWLTPIMWNPEVTMGRVIHTIFKFNPVYYIVDGFRDALLDKMWFWEKPVWTIAFWCVTVAIYLIGAKMFNRLKVHFSDVL